jgi:GNAT superfamily N-acetyltransferase
MLSPRLDGFHVRTPRPHEAATLLSFFTGEPLGSEKVLVLGAFAQPGDVPLGAAIVRPSHRGGVNVGHFFLFVRPEFRRQGIGARLMNHLYGMALANHAQWLILGELIHQDRPENAFCRAVGLSPERSFATYSLSIAHALEKICGPIADRFERTHPHLAGAEILPLDQIDAAQAARFFAAHHSGYVGQRLSQFESNAYDRAVSGVAVRNGEIFAGLLVRSKPGESSVLIDLVLSLPPYRNGPTPLVLLAHGARLALEKKYTHCVFEADEHFDLFAAGCARRCGAKPQWLRHRYSISNAHMATLVSTSRKPL